MATQPRVFYQKESFKKRTEINGKQTSVLDPVNSIHIFGPNSRVFWKPEDPDPNS
jgi:hypothetical protein